MAKESKVAEVPEAAEAVEVAEVPEAKGSKAKARTEKFERVTPDGETVIITRNIDTGEQTVAAK